MFLGGDAFRRRVQERFGGASPSREIPLIQRRATRVPLSEIVRISARLLGVDPAGTLERRRSRLRLAVAYLGRQDAMAGLVELGTALGVSVSSAHEIWASARRLRQHEPSFRAFLRRVRAEIRKIET